jgi:hypothetical protein
MFQVLLRVFSFLSHRDMMKYSVGQSERTSPYLKSVLANAQQKFPAAIAELFGGRKKSVFT